MIESYRDKLNEIDHKCINEDLHFYDLRSLFEAVAPKLSAQDKEEIKKVIQNTDDAETIAAVLMAKAKDDKNESLEKDTLDESLWDNYLIEFKDLDDGKIYSEEYDGYDRREAIKLFRIDYPESDNYKILHVYKLTDEGWEETYYNYDESLKEKLVDAPQEVIDKLLEILEKHGFILDDSIGGENPSKSTLFGDIHIQVINPDSSINNDNELSVQEQLKNYISKELIDEIHNLDQEYNCPITWNFGPNNKGQVTGGLDIMKQYVEESFKENLDISQYNQLSSTIKDAGDTYAIFRKIDNGKGKWAAAKYIDGSPDLENAFEITYEQARGFEPLSHLGKLSKKLGKEILPQQSLEEASYGGIYDIEDDMYFTKEELVEFGDNLAEQFSAWANDKCELSDVYMTSPVDLVMEVSESDGAEHQAKVKIDMRKIKLPKDIEKYTDTILKQWKDSYNEYHSYDESLNEDVIDNDSVTTIIKNNLKDMFYTTPNLDIIGNNINFRLNKHDAASVTAATIKKWLKSSNIDISKINIHRERGNHWGTPQDYYDYTIRINESLNEAYSNRYSVRAYHSNNHRGLVDIFSSDDFDKIRDKAHDFLWQGCSIVVDDNETGKFFTTNPDEYFDKFEGEGIQPHMFHESLDDTPYTYEQMESELKSATYNWKKDNFEGWVYYIDEFESAMQILSDHYENVDYLGHTPEGYGFLATRPSLFEDTVKQNGKWVNKGKEGTHGKFATKKQADAQRKAMFAHGYKAESLEESDRNRYKPVKRLALDGKTWWVVWDNKENKYSTKMYHGKYKTREEAEQAIEYGNKKYDESLDEAYKHLNNREKQVYIDIINNPEECEDIDDLKDIVHEIFFYDRALFAMLNKFPKDASFEELKANKISILKDSMLDESLKEDYQHDKDEWGNPYSFDEVEKELKNITNNWTDKEGTIRCYWEQEKNYGLQILKKHYKYVDVSDGRTGHGEDMSWVLAYSEPKEKLDESFWFGKYTDLNKQIHKVYFEFDSSDFEEAEKEFDSIIPEPYVKATLSGRADEAGLQRDGFTKLNESLNESVRSNLQDKIIDCIDWFIMMEMEFPKGEFLADSWEDLKDGIEMGVDPEFEVAEGIVEYFKPIVTFNKRYNKEVEEEGVFQDEIELYKDLVRAMNNYLAKNGYEDRIKE